MRPNKFLQLLLLLILSQVMIGCEKLQPGYYLTPENYPTQPPHPTETLTPHTPSPTPISTVRVVETPTPTPRDFETPIPTPSQTPIPLLCDETSGQIVKDSFYSRLVDHEVHYRVYLPPCYAASQHRYPYLIMLHGLGAGMNDEQWDRMGLDEAADEGYASGALPPIIIVMPDGTDAKHDWDAGPYPEVIINELLPMVESTFCAWGDSSKRAIGGLSRGGYWAYWIAFRYPDLFSRVGGHSPYFYTASSATDKNPDNLVDTAIGIEHLTMYIDHGAQDYSNVQANARDFVKRLQQRGINPEYVTHPSGNHNEDYWSVHVSEYLIFYTAGWPRNANEFPVCSSVTGN